MPPKQRGTNSPRHRTQPIPETLTAVHGYPDKLKIYQCDASPYWYVRYYHEGRIRRRSTRTESKREAITVAKQFYDEINREHADQRAIANGVAFRKVAEAYIESNWRRVRRNDLTEITAKNAEYRLNGIIIPFFGDKDINDIGYLEFEEFLGHLNNLEKPLASSTITHYAALVKQVFKFALQTRSLEVMPPFPKVSRTNRRRPHFSTTDYKKVWSRAENLIGTRFHYRVIDNEADGTREGFWVKKGEHKESRLIRTVAITYDLREAIVFMVNSYIRPSDLKNIKHKHVEKRTSPEGHRYLRLNLPPSKNHDQPIVTMEHAINVYDRLTNRHKESGRGTGPEDYLFLPDQLDRNYALRLLQYQLSALLSDLGLKHDVDGTSFSTYSLRHSCLMFRLQFGDPMATYLLARNARTGADMLDRFYLRDYAPEMNVDLLQSRRSRSSKNQNSKTRNKDS